MPESRSLSRHDWPSLTADNPLEASEDNIDDGYDCGADACEDASNARYNEAAYDIE